MRLFRLHGVLTKICESEQVALATYIDPGANKDTWARLISMPSDKVSVLVANVVNESVLHYKLWVRRRAVGMWCHRVRVL
jgi:hypothetical protein